MYTKEKITKEENLALKEFYDILKHEICTEMSFPRMEAILNYWASKQILGGRFTAKLEAYVIRYNVLRDNQDVQDKQLSEKMLEDSMTDECIYLKNQSFMLTLSYKEEI